jgi:hypothetical protein
MNYCLQAKQGVHPSSVYDFIQKFPSVFIYIPLPPYAILFPLFVATLLFIDRQGWQHFMMKYGYLPESNGSIS